MLLAGSDKMVGKLYSNIRFSDAKQVADFNTDRQ